MNKTREQWTAIDAKFCALQNSATANWYLIRDAQQDIAELHRERDALLAERDRMAEALGSMTCAYRMAIQAGHARITALGGDCDSVEQMLADFPDYGKAVELYKSHRAALQGEQP